MSLKTPTSDPAGKPQQQEKKESQYGELWPRMSELESQCLDGISVEERYDREVALVCDHPDGIKIEKDDRILDIASGFGDHAKRLAKRGAFVEAREYEEDAVKGAEGHISDDVRNRINLTQGDMTDDVKLKLKPGEKFKYITILGGSFIYLPTHEAHVNALKSFCSRLEPGGKIAFQWREHKDVPNPFCSDQEYLKDRGYSLEDVEGRVDAAGRIGHWKMMKSLTEGDGVFYANPKDDKEGVLGKKKRLQPYPDMPDTVGTGSYSRTYVDKEGKEHPMDKVTTIDYMHTSAFNVFKRMLEEAGFVNVKIIPDKENGAELAKDGSRRLFAIVAEKPKSI